MTLLSSDSSKTAYRSEVEQPWRRQPSTLIPLTISNSSVSTVDTFKFLGTIISRDLKWESNISSFLKKAQQRVYFLRLLRKLGLPQELLIQFYTAVPCTPITVWFGAATVQDWSRLQRTIKTAAEIIGAPLPTLKNQETGREHHHRSVSPQTQRLSTPAGATGLVHQNKRTQ
ncbi:hypothetical protein NFI96_022209, partial [Prochilodus magdalenae]